MQFALIIAIASVGSAAKAPEDATPLTTAARPRQSARIRTVRIMRASGKGRRGGQATADYGRRKDRLKAKCLPRRSMWYADRLTLSRELRRMNLAPLPITAEATIPESYLDAMGHMN